MKSVEITGSKRTAVGKKDTKKLRAADQVPCVLYGGEEPIHFQANAAEFRKVIYTPSVYLIDLNIDGERHKAIMQDVQFHPIEEQILHCDFLRISDEKPIKIEVPVKVEGYAAGMRSGGKMKLNLRRLKVKGLAKNIPDTINIHIDDLDVGQSIKVGQLNIENLEFLNSKAVPVVSIMITRAARAAASSTPAKES
ncbi:MAG: 50S ribosomal protein L25/general stress protein Ctc [Mangrovibacterium sp.]|nr:50S ribosomal protein L25/general stress protein Ctc [Mangrovibacterium sp.]